MADSEATLRALAEQIQALQQQVAKQQQAMAEQQEIITQQQEAMAQQQEEVAALRAQVDAVDRASEAAGLATTDRRVPKTSRRRLLTTAGAAAAATAGVVALGAANVAHAATGDSLLLGEHNDADSTTWLNNTVGTTPPQGLLYLENDSGPCIFAIGGNNSFAIEGLAHAAGSMGVSGSSDSGYGVVGSSNTGIDIWAGGTGRFEQQLQSASGAPSSGSFNVGEQVRDASGELWLCTQTGSPGTWVKVAHLAPGATNGGATTYLSRPVRLLDSRPGATDALNNGGGPYATGSTNTLTIAGVSFNGVTVPSTAVGAFGNVTVVTQPGANGYVAIVPHGAGFSGTSSVNYSTGGAVIANFFNVGLASGAVDIIVGGAGSTDVIIDVFAVVA